MLTIGTLLESYGITAGDVARYAAQAVGLGEAYESTRNYVRFTSSYRQAYPGTTRGQADLAYRLGKYWFEAGSALSQIDPNQVIPRQLASVSSKASETIGVMSPYNYTVAVSFFNPVIGQWETRSNIVSSDTPLSLNKAYARAYSVALEQIINYDPWKQPAEFYEALEPDFFLQSFHRYEQG